jgi:addiction module RelE/StbE family toxin
MVEVNWTKQSLEDIENIAEYISKDSQRYAEIQVEEFFNSVNKLQYLPKSGRIVPEVNDENLRELLVGFYRVIYRVKSTTNIDILTVYHSMRLLTKRKVKSL